ncbi:MAG: S8 family peptidase [Prevotella sp.]|nr:S8 family peptidase [Prevotella sp.]
MNTHAQLGYYLKGEFISLTPDMIPACYVQAKDANAADAVKKQLSRTGDSELASINAISSQQFYIKGNIKIEHEGIYKSIFYKIADKGGYVVKPRISVGLKKGADIKDILKEYPELSIAKILNTHYRLHCNVRYSDDVLKLSMELSKKEEVEWCEPVLNGGISTFDTYYPQQFYLHNTTSAGYGINAEKAWYITKGTSNITVAVIDEGLEPHDDLGSRIYSGYTCGNDMGAGAPQNWNANDQKTHGMAVAGIIGATHNSIGIRGVADNIGFLPVNIFPNAVIQYFWGKTSSMADPDEIADAIRWAYPRADILNCSWGYNNYYTEIAIAINEARTLGRNGKGCVIVAASGNSHIENAYVAFPARMDGVIAVGAIKGNGEITSYSQRGDNMNLVAFGGEGDEAIVTLDRMGTVGKNSGNYDMTFRGTSASCPQVAGVAALMLSIRPDLTEEQVRNILYATAKDLGASGYDTTYGYGLVDAYAALDSINHPARISGTSVLCSPSTYELAGLPDGYTVTWNIGGAGFSMIPSQQSCTVSSTDYDTFKSAMLTANIYYEGQLIRTLTKALYTHGELFVEGRQYAHSNGTGRNYPDWAFTIPNISQVVDGSEEEGEPIDLIVFPYPEEGDSIITAVPSQPSYASVDINPECEVKLSSKSFLGMNISFGTDKPSSFTADGEHLSFVMPYHSWNYPFVINFTNEGGCNEFSLNFHVKSAPIHDMSIIFNVVKIGSQLKMSILNGSGEDPDTGAIYIPDWSFTIYNFETGGLVTSGTVHGEATTVDVSTWASGIYIIRAVCNGQTYTVKVSI